MDKTSRGKNEQVNGKEETQQPVNRRVEFGGVDGCRKDHGSEWGDFRWWSTICFKLESRVQLNRIRKEVPLY